MRQLQIKSLPSKKEAPWLAKTEILYHAVFQIFEDFITQEYSNKNFNLEPWDLSKCLGPNESPDYYIEDNDWKLKCKEILSFWSEMKKYSSCWDRAHAELEHKIKGIYPVFDDWLEPQDANGNRLVKAEKKPKVYWDTLKEMGDLEEYYENKINEYCGYIIAKRRWMWT